MPLRNRLYAGIVAEPEYGVRAKRGDFEPLISEDLVYRVLANRSSLMGAGERRGRWIQDRPPSRLELTLRRYGGHPPRVYERAREGG